MGEQSTKKDKIPQHDAVESKKRHHAAGGSMKAGSSKRQHTLLDSAVRKNGTKNISHHDVQDPPRQYIVVRGPNVGGFRSFDKVSIFANNMKMKADQVVRLKNQASDYPAPPIKHYVFKMTKSSVMESKCKMEFSLAFSKKYLNQYLEQPIFVKVSCNRSEELKYVKMKAGKRGNAIMTSGWKEPVEEFNLKKGNICMFSFRDQNGTRFHDKNATLRLVIVPLDN